MHDMDEWSARRLGYGAIFASWELHDAMRAMTKYKHSLESVPG